MTSAQLAAFMERHKLGSLELARIIGISRPGVDHWLTGRRSIAKPYARLMRLFDKYPQLMSEFK